MLDDTCYFVACDTEAEARLLHDLLSSKPAKEFYSAFVFWDAKRPITTELLRRLDLWKLSRVLRRSGEFRSLCMTKARADRSPRDSPSQLGLSFG